MTMTNFFPKTPASVIHGFYHEMAKKPSTITRGEYAEQVFEKYFDKDYVEMGGNGNKSQDFEQFKSFITGTFSQLPNLDVFLEEMVANGDKVTVKIKLEDKENKVEINYLALYHIADGKIKNRYAYSDGGF